MACWLDWITQITQLYDAWAIRVLVLFSFALHVVLILFADIRRREATGFWRSILWLANQSVDWTATYVLGNLSLGSTSQQQELVALWASFLLVHLGRPDNVSAYSLEDDKLSGRQVVEVISQFIGAFFVLFKHIPFCDDGGTLFPATSIMFAVGFAKYVERTLALLLGDFGSIRRSGEKQKLRSFSADLCGGQELDDEQALLVAHRIFRISKGAFADYSVVKDPLKHPDDRDRHDDRDTESFPHGWKGMCKVVEMELSLMYDILYTKAAIVHTWHGYLLRFVSPPLTAVAFLLFWFYNKAGQRRVDVVITYILLTATFLVDLRWLVGALGSTWTYAFLKEMASTRWCWLRHKLLCTGRWHRLRRVVVSLDPRRLLCKEPASYRKWSGTIGQYNLLHECTHDTPSLLRTLAKNIGLEDWLESQDNWMEYQYHYWGGLDISKKKELLFEWIREILKEAYPDKMDEDQPTQAMYPALMVEIPKRDEAARRRRLLDEALKFAPELGEDILVLHIATDVFLRCSDQNAARCTCVKAIKELSDYMMFLVAVRPDMVPGLKLSSLHKTTRDALKDIWRSCPSSTAREKKLACILRNKEQQPSTCQPKNRSLLYDSSIILSDGARLANVLLGLLKNEPWHTDEEDYKETARIFKFEKSRGGERIQIEQELLKNKALKAYGEAEEALKAYEEARAETARIFNIKIEYEEALNAYEEALKAYAEALKAYEEARKAYEEARKAYEEAEEALKAYEEARAETARIFNIKIEKLQDGAYTQNELLEDIFRGWVRMLIYVSVRCSRDSHAKQLSRGGELTTIVWILAEHASIFGIPE